MRDFFRRRMGNGGAGRPVFLLLLIFLLLTVAPPAFGQGSDGLMTTSTPWGDPDLQGIWTSATLTPLERPDGQTALRELSDAEAGQLEQDFIALSASRDGKASLASGYGGYNAVWLDQGKRITESRRTSLIVNPPDGRIPWTREARWASEAALVRRVLGPFDSHLDLDTGERCITDGLPNMVPLQPYNMNMQIFQAPGVVAMLHEMYHELRVVPLDDRPWTGIRQWTGEARGHWEGATLVVETRGFVDRPTARSGWMWRRTRPSLHLVERFTRVDAQTIDYTFTVEDPETFTQPWTASAPMTTDHASRGVTPGNIWEYACHEGNYAMINQLRGAGGGNIVGVRIPPSAPDSDRGCAP